MSTDPKASAKIKIEEKEDDTRVTFNIPQNPKPKKEEVQPNPSEAPQDEEKSQNLVDDYELGAKIGAGAFANVFKVTEKKTGKVYAAKVLRKIMNETPGMKRSLKREVDILSQLNHPGVLKFIRYSPTNFKQKPRPVIITEYAPNGSLYDLIKMERNEVADPNWDDTRKLTVLYGIASALSYLHSNKIDHRDLKPSNILMDEFLLPKIGDFGLSKINHNQESMTMKSTVGIKGTPLYLAPEVWEKQDYSEKSDVYAFGIIMYEIMTAQVPFDQESVFDIQPVVKSGRRPVFKYPIDQTYQYLIESCWDQDPNKRPSFERILDQLKNDPGFITPNIDEKEYQNYVSFVDDYKASFDKNKKVDITKFEDRQSQIFKSVSIVIPAEQKEDVQHNLLCPDEYFENLDEERQHIIEDAENDPFKQCMVGQFLVEGIEGFPQETDVGVQYLDKSIKAGCVEACCYYCNLLIRGQFVSNDLDIAKSYLEMQLDSHDGIIYLLYGRVMRKLGKFAEAQKYFRKGSNEGSNEAMYEYGKMMYRGEGCEKNEEEANKYFDLAKRNGYYKAYEFINKQKKEERRRKKGDI